MSKSDKNNQPKKMDEVVYEPDSSGDELASGNYQDKIKKIREELHNCQKEKQEYLDGWQRAKADFINFRKRSEEEKKDTVRYATQNFILEILPTLDSFEHAFRNKEHWESAPAEWRQGVESIYSQLRDVLTRHGVREINPIDEPFDPKLHHSVDVVPVTEDKDNGKIVEVLQKGYALNDKIIRCPNVRVGKKE
ncbi:MAG TPA: nucleotide exchange factor GrpE [Candidatus Paceibacterota bacterium]|nr:nucleotide exchange factor GrpE [Candidatus Paceibacterota bacterium]HRZ34548.1 nucleotide exchange factor GrpE [Candidatus Paceibacterota bacterium]